MADSNHQPDLSNESIQRAEHIDPSTTGDNIAAKKVASYGFDGSNWQRLQVDGSGNLNTNVNKDSTGYTFYSSKITTTAGDVITPTSSKALKIHKVMVTNSANNSTFVDVSLTGATKGTFLQGEAIASSWVITLDVDEVLTIGTDVNGSVYVNIQYEEV